MKFNGYIIILSLTLIFIVILKLAVRNKKLKEFRNQLKSEQLVQFLDEDMDKKQGTIKDFQETDQTVRIISESGKEYFVEPEYIFPA